MQRIDRGEDASEDDEYASDPNDDDHNHELQTVQEGNETN